MIEKEEGEVISSDEEIDEDKCSSLNLIKEVKKESVPDNHQNSNNVLSKKNKRNYDVFQNNEIPNKKRCFENTMKDKKKYLCKYYANGGCKNRSSCTFMHEDFPCKFHHDSETVCKVGENCRYSHAPINSDIKEIFEAFKLDKSIDRISPPKDDTTNRVRCLLPNPTENEKPNINHSQPNLMYNTLFPSTNNSHKSVPVKSRFSDVRPTSTVHSQLKKINKQIGFVSNLPVKPGQPITRLDLTKPPPNILNNNNSVSNGILNNIPANNNHTMLSDKPISVVENKLVSNANYLSNVASFNEKIYEQKQNFETQMNPKRYYQPNEDVNQIKPVEKKSKYVAPTIAPCREICKNEERPVIVSRNNKNNAINPKVYDRKGIVNGRIEKSIQNLNNNQINGIVKSNNQKNHFKYNKKVDYFKSEVNQNSTLYMSITTRSDSSTYICYSPTPVNEINVPTYAPSSSVDSNIVHYNQSRDPRLKKNQENNDLNNNKQNDSSDTLVPSEPTENEIIRSRIAISSHNEDPSIAAQEVDEATLAKFKNMINMDFKIEKWTLKRLDLPEYKSYDQSNLNKTQFHSNYENDPRFAASQT